MSTEFTIAGRRADIHDVLFLVSKYVILLVLLAVIILPYAYALSITFRLPNEFFRGAVKWLPQNPVLKPWFKAWEIMGPNYMNTILVAIGTMVISLFITIPGAYVFGRKEFPGKHLAFYLIVFTLLFPYILLIIPIATMWQEIGLFDTIPGLWIAYQAFVTPFAVWILRDYFAKLPVNLEEAAMVYGCTQWSAFVRVILPISLPAVMAVGFLAFLIGWNDFLFSNMLTQGSGAEPAVVTLFRQMSGGERVFWAQVLAMVFIVGTPPTVLYMIARRQLTSAFAVS